MLEKKGYKVVSIRDKKACDEIAVGSVDCAQSVISAEYPFMPLSNAGRAYSEYQKTKIFLQDGFID
ncbi:hypothetical protein [Nitrosomonas ureae]|uniref:Uncharacterized protein n=1 Tax=Nitrosomonas ureae TaxID=44577 RepID=A0A2T5IS00_9PROT|nr:hypothetical protein [Nitrosomonas ureae]PTQ86588.1 hypothetical protein C8R28_100917 [Nitrosomonas ureae]